VAKAHFAVSDLLWGDEAPVFGQQVLLGFVTIALKHKIFFDDSCAAGKYCLSFVTTALQQANTA
jgi:hypothetical protein